MQTHAFDLLPHPPSPRMPGPWVQGSHQDSDSDDEDLRTLHPRSEGLPHLKSARLCRGFKRMYARPCKRDPANRPAPQEQVEAGCMLVELWPGGGGAKYGYTLL